MQLASFLQWRIISVSSKYAAITSVSSKYAAFFISAVAHYISEF